MTSPSPLLSTPSPPQPSDRRSSSSAAPESLSTEVNWRFEEVIRAALQKSSDYEQQIRDLELKVTPELNETRSLRDQIAETFATLTTNHEKVDRSLNRDLPQLVRQLDHTMSQLEELDERLPVIQAQVEKIRAAYDSGRQTAKDLTSDLEWRTSSIADKGRRILLTRTAPISFSEIILIRILVYISFLIFAWRFGVALEGAYRAYRHRLVWGDKLMS